MVNAEPPMVDAPWSSGPPAPRAPRRRRKRWPWVVGIIVLVLFGLFTIADRIVVGIAEKAVADRIADQTPFKETGVKPHVSINGFPFLTQALGGKYDDIEVTGDALTLDGVRGIDLDAHMHGVHVPLSNAMDRKVTSLPIDHLAATATVPYTEAARRTGIEGLQLSDNHGALRVTLAASVAQLGNVTASADADLHVTGNHVTYTVREISVNGQPVSDALAPQVRQMMNGALTLPALPYHLQVTGVQPTGSGIQATAVAEHIVVDTQ